MAKARNSNVWLEEGYNLYAREGMEGIQIERLARILQLNKSGFYHYFGDLEGYRSELIDLHKRTSHDFIADAHRIKAIDPDYFELLVKYKVSVLFQVQVMRVPQDGLFYEVGEQVDRMKDIALRNLWSDYLGVPDRPELATRYFGIVRDSVYTRITFDNYDFTYLRTLFTDAKVVLRQFAEGNMALESHRSLS
jgi:AcrR family transcriptional regulator